MWSSPAAWAAWPIGVKARKAAVRTWRCMAKTLPVAGRKRMLLLQLGPDFGHQLADLGRTGLDEHALVALRQGQLGSPLHVGWHELLAAHDAVGVARERRNQGRVFGVHDEVLEQLRVLHILGVGKDGDIVHPDGESLFRIAELDRRVL